jgi:hypothetical protein
MQRLLLPSRTLEQTARRLVSGRREGAKEGHTMCPFEGVWNAEASITLKLGIPCTSKVESGTPPFSNGPIPAEHIGWYLLNIR